MHQQQACSSNLEAADMPEAEETAKHKKYSSGSLGGGGEIFVCLLCDSIVYLFTVTTETRKSSKLCILNVFHSLLSLFSLENHV